MASSSQTSTKTLSYAKEQLRAFTPKRLDDDSQLDSGYGSQDSSQATTPDKLGACENSNLPKEPGIELRLSKTKTLLAFDTGLDEHFTTRFYHIQPSIESLLLQYTRRKSFLRASGRHKPMAIRLLPLGTSELDAKPFIVVFCAPEMRKRVQHFFDTDEIVKSLYKPQDSSLPGFDVVVCGCAPQLRNGENLVQILCDSTADATYIDGFKYKTASDLTFCGTPIRIQGSQKSKNATFGGLIKLDYGDGTSRLCGLTAGHLIRECLESPSDVGGEMEVIESDGDDSTDSYVSDSDSDSEWSQPDLKETNDSLLGSQHSVNKSDSWAFERPQALGSAPSHADAQQGVQQPSQSPFDWALVDVKRYQPNRLPSFMFRGNVSQWIQGITEWRTKSPNSAKNLSEDRVILMCGSSGPKFGSLAPQPARIALGASAAFVDTYMVVLDSGDAIADGDSGSWVVAEDTRQVIGHVVATDALGAGYVIPLCDIFADIRKSLQIYDVTLPSLADIDLANATANLLKAPNEASEKQRGGSSDDKAAESFQVAAEPYHYYRDPSSKRALDLAASKDNLQQVDPTLRKHEPETIQPMNLPPPFVHEQPPRSSRRYLKEKYGIYVNGENILEPVPRRNGEQPHRRHEAVVAANRYPPRSTSSRFSQSKHDSAGHDSGYSSYGGSSSGSSSGSASSSTSNSPNFLTPLVAMNSRSIVPHRSSRNMIVDTPPSDHRRAAISRQTIDLADPEALINARLREARRAAIMEQMLAEEEAEAAQRVERRLADAKMEISARSREAKRVFMMQQRINLANAEIAGRPPVPSRPPMQYGNEKRTEGEAELVEAIRAMDLASQPPYRKHVSKSTRTQARKFLEEEQEEEVLRRRMRERMQPRAASNQDQTSSF